MPSGSGVSASATTCSGTFVDNGGSGGNYSNNQRSLFTFCPSDPNKVIRVSFSSFQIEASFDSLIVVNRDAYTGNVFTEPNLFGVFWGNDNPGTVTSTHSTGCLTFLFSADGSIDGPGWEATISCVDPCVDIDGDGAFDINCGGTDCDDGNPAINPDAEEIFCNGIDDNCNGDDDIPLVQMLEGINVSAFTNYCCGTFVDNGDISSNYDDNQRSLYTICPSEPNKVIQVSFNSFEIEEGFDSLIVVNRDAYTGSTFSEPNLIGVFWGTDSPGTVTSNHSTGCLTFLFSADGSINGPGWDATISCVEYPGSCDAPTATCAMATVNVDNGAVDLNTINDLFFNTVDCGFASESVVPSSLDCSNLGTNTVTYTVTDINGATSSCTSTIEVPGLPCGWSGPASGVNCPAGSFASYDPSTSTFSISSDGCYDPNYYSSTDLHGYAGTQLCGDGEIIAQVTEVNGNGWAGISMREDLNPGAKMLQLNIDGSFLTKRELRQSTGGVAFTHSFQTVGHNWLRLTRTGNQFGAYRSTDGINWSVVLVTSISMTTCIEVGLITENNTPTGSVTGTFESVSINGVSPLTATPSGLDVAQTNLAPQPAVDIYPNPAKNNAMLELSGFSGQDVQVRILEPTGEAVQSLRLEEVYTATESLNFLGLSSGVYMVVIQTETSQLTKRLVVVD